MMRFLTCLALLCPVFAQAEPVDLSFDSVKLPEFVKVIYSDVLKQSAVFDAEFVKSEALISVNLHAHDSTLIQSRVIDIVHAHGFSVVERGGVHFVGSLPNFTEKKPAPLPLIYRPLHRPAADIVAALLPIFPDGFRASRPELPAPATAGRPDDARSDTDNPPSDSPPPSPSFVTFRGSPDDLRLFLDLVKQVDTPPNELTFRAAIYEVTLSNEDKSALSLAASLLSGKLGISIGSADPGQFSAVFRNATLQIVLDAFATDHRFRVLSSPSLRVLDGAKARLMVGSETPTLGEIKQDKNGNNQQSVVYKPSGVILELQPNIRDSHTDLSVVQQLSEFVATSSGVNNSPTLLKRELSTRVSLRPDDLLILGGLDEQKSTAESTGLSFLPAAFAGESRKVSRSAVLMILQAVKTDQAYKPLTSSDVLKLSPDLSTNSVDKSGGR